eukprot:gene5321-7092_t
MSTLAMTCTTVKRNYTGYILEDSDQSPLSLNSPLQAKKCRMMAPPREYVATTPETDKTVRKMPLHRRPLPPVMRDHEHHDHDSSDDNEEEMDDREDDLRSRHRNNRQYSIHHTQFVPQTPPESDEFACLQENVAAPQPVKFTLKQVISIVNKAIRSREIELQEEFGNILARKLEGKTIPTIYKIYTRLCSSAVTTVGI